MFEEGENCFYYITTMNENYVHPDMPEDVEEGIVRGLYRLSTASVSRGLRSARRGRDSQGGRGRR